MAWYGKYEEESDKEKLEKRIKAMEKKIKSREDDDNFSMTSSYISDDSDD